MANVTPEILAVREQLVNELKIANRSSVSLIRQGYTRSNVQLGLAAMLKAGRIYKYGAGKATYYSIHPTEPKPEDVGSLTDPITIPDALVGDFKLAFRMGYTTIAPKTGRVYKEILT